MTPQQIAFTATLIAALAGLAVKLNWIDKNVYDLLVSTETLNLVVVLGGAVAGLWGLYISRKHGIIETTAGLKQVDAVITKPKTAGEIAAPNVVGSVQEAATLPKAAANSP